MTGQELFEWLEAIPEVDRRKAMCILETSSNFEKLTTAKIYTNTLNELNKKKTIYLINK